MTIKKLLKAVMIFILLPVIILSAVLFRFAAARKLYIIPKITELFKKKSDDKSMRERVKPAYNAGCEWVSRQSWEELNVNSHDGLKLYGRYLKNNGDRTIILCHGFRGSDTGDFAGIVRFLYEELGLSVLMITERSHGKSEGKYICYGIKERYDIKEWTKQVLRKNPEEQIFLYGISMGSSAVMMSTSVCLPENVKGLICDCGYTSAYDIFSCVLKSDFHLPAFPFVNIADIFARLFAGYSFKDCTAIDSIAQFNKPVLFFHGSDDKFVPSYMSEENFKACKADKKLVIINGAEHALSYYIDYQKYTSELKSFISRFSD